MEISFDMLEAPDTVEDISFDMLEPPESSLINQTSQIPQSFIQQAKDSQEQTTFEPIDISGRELQQDRLDKIKQGNYEDIDESVFDKLYKVSMGDKAYRDKKLREEMNKGKEEHYLKTTINNTLTATGNAILATGAGINKIAEDLTGKELNADEAIKIVEATIDSLSTDTKLVGDIVGSSILAPGTIVLPSVQLGLQTLGEGGTYGQAGVNTIGAMLLGKTGQLVINKLTGKVSDDLIDLMVQRNQGRISADEVNQKFAGLPTEDKVTLFAESQNMFRKNIEKAVQNSSDAAKLGKRLERRKVAIDKFRSTEGDFDIAKTSYNDMLKTLDDTKVIDTSGLVEDVDKLSKIYKTDPTTLGTAIKNIKADLEAGLTVRGAVDIRQNINGMLRKPSVKTSKVSTKSLTNIKDQLDKTIKTNIPDQAEAVYNTIGKYRKTVNEFKMGELIDKHTKADYAVDWKALEKDIKKEGLRGGNVDIAMPVIEEFSTRFANDKFLGNVITPKGAGDAGGVLTLFSKAVEVIKDFFVPIYDRSRNKDLKIQDAILKTIRKNEGNYLGFVDDIVKNNRVPEELKIQLKNLDLLEYKPKLSSNYNTKYSPDRNYVSLTDDTGQQVGALQKRGNSWEVDIQGFKEGKGQGEDFYQKAFNFVDNQNERLTNPTLYGNNIFRYPINQMNYMLSNPETKIFKRQDVVRKLESARNYIKSKRLEVSDDTLKSIDNFIEANKE